MEKLILKVILVLLLSPFCVLAQNTKTPISVQKWLNQYSYFQSLLSVDTEEEFRNQLIEYYKQVYKGPILQRLTDYIKNSYRAGHDYIFLYNPFHDVKTESITSHTASDNSKMVLIKQSQDFFVDYCYSPPHMSSIVDKYKIKNISQEEVNQWVSKVNAPFDCPAFDIKIKKEVRLFLSNDVNPLITETKHTIIESVMELPPIN